ncbi:MAG: class I mannose-6-phosphate isomerase [Anaerolineaceae bacterium]|nr:class I mannose-6-phosphate isomerase [Anaerolineaceae bacterium]
MNESSTQPVLYPFLFEPVLKNYIWGGRNLEKYERILPPGKTAESWEIAAHKNGSSIILNGIHQGKSLTELTAEFGIDIIGSNAKWALDRGKFPLLVKLLDANQRLSVQVHPKDDYALQNEDNELGKTEMWVVLHAEPDAKLVYGVRKGTTRENFKRGIQQGNLEPYLNIVPVKSSDHICVPSGSLHAIMEGTIMIEIQQNSDTTYRVYDWNRLGNDGMPRELHIEKALDVINFEQIEPQIGPAVEIESNNGIRRYMLCHNEYFVTERIEFEDAATYTGTCDGSSLEIWGIINGRAKVDQTQLDAIQFTLLPAAYGDFSIVTEEPAVMLRTTIPASA